MNKHFGCCRFVYNYFLALRKERYSQGIPIDGFECKKMLKELKNQHPWLKEVNSQLLQELVLNLEKAYRRFSKKLAGYPQFKKKKKWQTFTVPQFFKVIDNCLFIPKLPSGIKIKLHRPIIGQMKRLVITKTPTGKFFASITCELEKQPLPKVTGEVGVDLGVKNFATLSTGETIEHPKYLIKSMKRLALLQRRLCRKKKGFRN